MQLTPFCLTLTCLRISPDRTQFFRYEYITLSCEDQLNSTGWKVRRKTPDGWIETCSSGWGSSPSGSTCVITNTYPSDSGEYWCQSEDGEISNSINVTISDRPVLLESPAVPVSEGAVVILRCKAEPSSSEHKFTFYKDGRSISSSSFREMTIGRASKSDEGLYRCSTAGGGESASSWLAVEGEHSPELKGRMEVVGGVNISGPIRAPPAASGSVFTSRLMCHLVVGAPYLLSTVLLGLIYRDRQRAARLVSQRSSSDDVIMEIVV